MGSSGYDAPMPLTIGQTFAGYRILQLLGSGGMGEVYLADHPRLPRRDALKILRSDVSEGDEHYRQRFIQEADLAGKLWHPNIVRVNDHGEDDGRLWIAVDFIDGTDAAHLLRGRPGGLPPRRYSTSSLPLQMHWTMPTTMGCCTETSSPPTSF